jgi:AcrR family transcriptional regulator
MGPQDSATWNALLDAAERVLRNEGYAAASSRRIAEEAGLKQQLVYYYFHTMDELLLAAFKRRTQRGLERLEKDIGSDRPLHALWQDYTTAADPRLAFEYMALANHHDAIREEVAAFLNTARRLQSERIARAYADKGVTPAPISPAAAAFLIGCITLLLRRETDIGVTIGHDDVKTFVEWCLKHFE